MKGFGKNKKIKWKTSLEKHPRRKVNAFCKGKDRKGNPRGTVSL